MSARRRRSRVLGIAVSPTEISAALPDGTIWSRPLDPPSGEGSWPALTERLRELGEETLRGARPVARFVVLPPLVQGRRLELPPLRSDEYRQVLERDAGRYFLTDRLPQVVTPVVLRRTRGARTSVFVAATPVHIVEALLQCAQDVGWKAAVFPAYSAWAASAGGPQVLVLRNDAETTVLGVENGLPAWLRRLPPGTDGDAVAAALGDAGTTLPPTAPAASPGALAATHARYLEGPELLPEARHAARRVRARRMTLRLAAATVALLLTSAALRLWEVQREVAAVRGMRTELRQAVNSALAARDTLLALEERVAVLAELEATAPRWTGVIGTLARALPKDAYVLSLRTAGDTLSLGGLAQEAAGVLAGLQDAGAFRTVRAEAPIRRELRDGEAPVERFTISVQVASAAKEVP